MSIIKKAEELGIEITNEIRIIALARQLGITEIVAHFEGGGDSGEIDDVSYSPSNKFEWNKADMTEEQVEDFQTLVELTSFDLVCHHTTKDWINNGGGNGNLTIDVLSGSISLEATYSMDEYSPDVANMLPEELTEKE
jgi:hypothetical protein